MTPEDKPRFAALMSNLGMVFNRTLSREFLTIYFDVLADVQIESLEEAAKKIIRTRPRGYFPMPAEIRNEALGISTPNLWGDAEAAWAYAMAFIDGPYFAWLDSGMAQANPRRDVDEIIRGTYRTWTAFIEALEADAIRYMKRDFCESYVRRRQAKIAAQLEEGQDRNEVALLGPEQERP